MVHALQSADVACGRPLLQKAGITPAISCYYGACRHGCDAAVPVQVYLRPYKLEEYEALVKPLKLWPFPRGHQRHLTMLPIQGATVLLADQRSCPLLPENLAIRAHPGLRPTAAARAMDCNLACSCGHSDKPQGILAACMSDSLNGWQFQMLLRHGSLQRMAVAGSLNQDLPFQWDAQAACVS